MDRPEARLEVRVAPMSTSSREPTCIFPWIRRLNGFHYREPVEIGQDFPHAFDRRVDLNLGPKF